jgi:hypothetical protein
MPRLMDADDFYEIYDDDPQSKYGALVLGPQFLDAYPGLTHGEQITLALGGGRGLRAWLVLAENGLWYASARNPLTKLELASNSER